MNAIQTMLEAMKEYVAEQEYTQSLISYRMRDLSDVRLEKAKDAIAAGEAELAREPFASAFKNNSGCGLYDYALYLQRDVDLAYRDNCLAIIPLFTRKEIK